MCVYVCVCVCVCVSPDVLWRGSDEGGSKYECKVLDTHLVLRLEGCHSEEQTERRGERGEGRGREGKGGEGKGGEGKGGEGREREEDGMTYRCFIIHVQVGRE